MFEEHNILCLNQALIQTP